MIGKLRKLQQSMRMLMWMVVMKLIVDSLVGGMRKSREF